ncbi:MAG: nucleotidyl transferase AbiEii/AbiGii toxin family protein [Bacteroidales bacterium]|nr:nucleotidyl transferase AbiEii/AbiGii toxin family protein [Bacteroidales bacterium]
MIDILRFLNETPFFRNSLMLKGGTAINLLVHPLTRLSVDIDLDYAVNCSKEEMLTSRMEINRKLLARMEAEGYSISPRSKSPLSLDSWMFQYVNSGGNRDYIKIEINYSMRSHLFNPVALPVISQMTEPFDVMTLNLIELYASKINALICRMAARDLYDVDGMIENRLIPEELFPSLRKSVVFYNKVGGTREIVREQIIKDIESIPFSTIKSDLLPMLHKGTFYDLPLVKKRVSDFISALCEFTDAEISFINEFNNRKYRPELLFDNSEIVHRIENHPMALWRTRD